MKKPMIVVGSGLAGIAAAHALARAGRPALLVDAGDRPGGELQGLRGEGWLSDTAAPYFRQADRTLFRLAVQLGLETDIVALQGAVVTTPPNESPERGKRDYAMGRVVFREGFQRLASASEREFAFQGGATVGALKWDALRRRFLLRDQTSGRVLRNPQSQREVIGAGLVLAVSPASARLIVASTGILEPLLPYFRRMTVERGMAATFVLPKWQAGWSVWEIEGDDDLLRWAALEDAKCVGRAPEGKSLLTVRLTAAAAGELWPLPEGQALDTLFGRLRHRMPGLPDVFGEARLQLIEDDRPSPGCSLRVPPQGVPTEPPGIPFGLAGNAVGEGTLESAAASGLAAARSVMERVQ